MSTEKDDAIKAENKGVTDPKLKVVDIINLHEKGKAYATDKNPYHETGSEISAHPYVIKELLKKGFATETKPKAAAEAT